MVVRQRKPTSHVRTPEQLYELASRFVQAREHGTTITSIQEEYFKGGRYISSATVHFLVRAWRTFESVEAGLLLNALRDLGYSRVALLLKLRDPVGTYRAGHLPGLSSPIRDMPVKELREWVADHRAAVQVIREVKEWSLRKAREAGLPIDGIIDLVVVGAYQDSFQCRSPVSRGPVVVTPRQGGHRPVPGEIVTVRVIVHSEERGHDHVVAEVQRGRVAPKEIGLVPLGMHPQGVWRPEEHYWGDRIERCFEPIIARGPRPEYEMAQIIPGGQRPTDPDPILIAMDRHKAGDSDGAKMMLMRLLAQDLRCLDAFAHLGLIHFHSTTFSQSVRYYEMGVRIGELSLGLGFDGVLPWGYGDNRPFLRCLHGIACCLWRDGYHEAAAEAFERLLWLNPWDNQGIRFIIEKVRKRAPWKP